MARRFYRRRGLRRYRRKAYRRLARTGRRYGRRRRRSNILLCKRAFQTSMDIPTLPIFYGAYSFKLSDLPNYAEFQALFDEYRICMIKMKFWYTRDAASAQVDTSGLIYAVNTTPLMTYVADESDANIPTAISQVLEYNNHKQRQLIAGRAFTVTLRPKVSKPLYQTGAFWGYSPGKAWINSTNVDVPHYGFKYAIQSDQQGAGAGAKQGVLSIHMSYYIAARNVK